MLEFDPFDLFRTLLFIVLTAYYVVVTAWTAWWLVDLLRGDDPQRRMIRNIITYQLVTFRVRPLAGELIQIGILAVLLLLLYWMHGWV